MNQLGQLLARGEPTAFAELYDLCADRCHHYLTVFLGSRDAADDVLQETFVRLVRNRCKLADVENLPAYLFVIARNEALRFIRCRKLERQRLVSLDGSDLFAEAHETARRDTALAVADGLQRLSAEQREVVELKIFVRLTFREIAEVTAVPLQTAATRYRAALQQLKEWFARQPS